MGFKPIFEEERQFFKEQTGYLLPTDCWRNGNRIYLDYEHKSPLIKFNVENHRIVITKLNNNAGGQKNLYQLINENKERLIELEKQSLRNIYDYIMKNPGNKYVISYSGGKDSDVIYNLWNKTIELIEETDKIIFDNLDWNINFANSTNDTSETYRKVLSLPKEKLRILNPQKGWQRWIEEDKNYFIPSVMVRNCCSTYKEGQITDAYDNNIDTTMVLGVRKYESVKRKEYELIMDYKWRKNHFGNSIFPAKWTNFAPIIDWKDEDVWLYMLWKGISYNKMYDYGFNRCGCLICPFMSDYVELLVDKYYHRRYVWWMSVLEKNYEIWGIGDHLKWTLDEWKAGKWKQGTSKEYELTTMDPTPERVKELADIKGLSVDMAKKYFKRSCSCGKKLNPTEIAMYYKTFGRYEDRDDDRVPLCRKCYCEKIGISKKEYNEKVIQFTAQGCTLF